MVKEEVIMGIRENVEKYFKDDSTKSLFEEIYEGFEKEGIGGIKKVLEKEVKRIKDEFESIKRDIEKQIGG